MNADIQSLFHSPLFRLFDFKCREELGSVSEPEWINNYSINFTRKGNFGYKISKDFLDIHSGVIFFENAGTECVVSHDHEVKDECTSLCVAESLLLEIAVEYFDPANLDACSAEMFEFRPTMIRSTPELEHFHMLIYQNALANSAGNELKIDLLIMRLLQCIFANLFNTKQVELPMRIDGRSKELHLETIDRGKNYILNNFQNQMSLSDIARNAHVSPFHFSRIFKYFTHYNPYQYLLEVRFNHAVLLLQNTSLSITEICFESGFNSLEHFIASFTKRHGVSPLKFRNNSSQ